MPAQLQLLDHPLAAQLLARLRDSETPPAQFRRLCHTLTTLLILEATRDFPLETVQVQTPLEPTTGHTLAQGLAVVPVLRAGLGMLEAALELFPDVAVGYVGLEREESTAIAKGYYSKLPNLAKRKTLCLDPMLATGGSASAALARIKSAGATQPTMVCVVAAPEGVARLQQDHPDVPIVAASLDSHLDHRKYIVPGVGDFGDRLYGTP
jgi:uracil phosphoribosyltransferase